MRCEMRTLDHIRALGGNDAADERRFETAAQISETNLALYRTYAQPAVRSLVNSPMADWLHQMHPLRLQYEMFSDANPMMQWVKPLADQVRQDRRPIASDNPFVAMQEQMSRQIVAGLDGWLKMTEAAAERTFLTTYGTPTLQAAAGIDPEANRPPRKAAKNPLHRELLQSRIDDIKARMSEGGLREAVIRGLLYVGMSRAAVDEREFEAVRRIRREHGDLPLASFKALVREQFYMLLVDTEAAWRQYQRCSRPIQRSESRRSISSGRCCKHAASFRLRTKSDCNALNGCSKKTQTPTERPFVKIERNSGQKPHDRLAGPVTEHRSGEVIVLSDQSAASARSQPLAR